MADILIVDDMATVLMAEKIILASLGHQVRSALSGEEALAEVKREVPDMVFCDMVMPGIDGPEFCRQMKQSLTTSRVPIVMVTTQSQSARMSECTAAGCDGYLPKPAGKSEMQDKIDELLVRRRFLA